MVSSYIRIIRNIAGKLTKTNLWRIRWETKWNSREITEPPRGVFLPSSLPLCLSSPDSCSRGYFYGSIDVWTHAIGRVYCFCRPGSRRPSNLHILHRADCPPYCVQPTAELLHIEHKLALLHHNGNTNGVHRHVRKVCVFSLPPLFSKNTIIPLIPKVLIR